MAENTAVKNETSIANNSNNTGAKAAYPRNFKLYKKHPTVKKFMKIYLNGQNPMMNDMPKSILTRCSLIQRQSLFIDFCQIIKFLCQEKVDSSQKPSKRAKKESGLTKILKKIKK